MWDTLYMKIEKEGAWRYDYQAQQLINITATGKNNSKKNFLQLWWK